MTHRVVRGELRVLCKNQHLMLLSPEPVCPSKDLESPTLLSPGWLIVPELQGCEDLLISGRFYATSCKHPLVHNISKAFPFFLLLRENVALIYFLPLSLYFSLFFLSICLFAKPHNLNSLPGFLVFFFLPFYIFMSTCILF